MFETIARSSSSGDEINSGVCLFHCLLSNIGCEKIVGKQPPDYSQHLREGERADLNLA